MKRFCTLILISFLLLMPFSSVSAKSGYHAYVKIPQVFYFNDSAEIATDYFPISLGCKNVSDYERFYLYVDYNKEVIDIFQFAVPDDLICGRITETDTGLLFSGSFPDEYFDRDSGPYSKYTATCSVLFEVKNFGEPEIKTHGYVIDLNGKKVELDISSNDYYNKIVDKDLVSFIDINDSCLKSYYVFFEDFKTVADAVSLVNSDNVFVKNADGKILEATDNVTTCSQIATLYNGYEVDSIPVSVRYDVDCDGKVTAADARLTLRYSAKLEKFMEEMSTHAANVDGKQGITAADARFILRKAANLE